MNFETNEATEASEIIPIEREKKTIHRLEPQNKFLLLSTDTMALILSSILAIMTKK